MPRAEWQAARRVLAVRLDTVGDVVMTTPALRALRAAVPGRRVTLLVSSLGAPAARLVADVDDVMVYDAPWLKATACRADSAPDRGMTMRLRRQRFDAAVIFTVYSQNPLPSALLCFLAEIPLRLAHCRENPYQLLTDWIADPEPHQVVRHEVRRQLDLVASVGATTPDERLAVAVPPAERARAQELLEQMGIDTARPWAVAHPGASAPSRRYPAESWAEACRLLAGDHGVQIVMTGDAGEAALVDRVQRAAGLPERSLAGRLGLGTLAALLEAAPLLMAGNTGPVHLAAAVGTPVVDLYALTNPQHTPWGVPNRVLFRDVPCRWCHSSICPQEHHRCLRGVAPAEVADAALSLLAASASERPSPAASPAPRRAPLRGRS